MALDLPHETLDKIHHVVVRFAKQQALSKPVAEFSTDKSLGSLRLFFVFVVEACMCCVPFCASRRRNLRRQRLVFKKDDESNNKQGSTLKSILFAGHLQDNISSMMGRTNFLQFFKTVKGMSSVQRDCCADAWLRLVSDGPPGTPTSWCGSSISSGLMSCSLHPT